MNLGNLTYRFNKEELYLLPVAHDVSSEANGG